MSASERKVSSINTVSEETERLLGFSDAVFAIAMTFLALELGAIPADVGAADGPTALEFLQENIRDYAVYFATFLIVGVFWWRHHLIFRYVKKTSGALLWLNIFILAVVAALPYPAGILSEATGLPLALVILLVPLTFVSLLLWLMWEVGVKQGLVIPGTPPNIVKNVRSQLAASPIVLALATVLALAADAADSAVLFRAAEATWLLLLIAPFVLNRIWPPPNEAYEVDEKDLSQGWESSAEVEAGEEQRVRSVLARMRNGSDTDRVKILTDGVVAIAVTILALQLHPPPPEDAQSNEELLANLNSAPIWTYLLTFIYISFFWRAHVRIFSRVLGVNTLLIWLNLIFLMFISFLPAPAALFGRDESSVAAAAAYLATMLLTSAAITGLAIYATYAKGLSVAFDTKLQRDVRTLRSVTLLVTFFVALVCVLVFQNPAMTNLVWMGMVLASVLARIVEARKRTEVTTST